MWLIKKHQRDVQIMLPKERADLPHRDPHCRVIWDAAIPSSQQREGNGLAAELLRQLQRHPVAARQLLLLAEQPVAPVRRNCVDDVLAGQLVPARDLGLPHRAAVQLQAVLQQLRPRRFLDRTVDAAPALQLLVGSVYNRVTADPRDFAGDDLK